jgi:hypothetical protein
MGASANAHPTNIGRQPRLARAAVAMSLLFVVPAVAVAQGVTTAGIRGIVSGEPGRAVDANVQITQAATGFVVGVRTSGGRFLVEGLEPGGPYTLSVRSLGFAAQRQEGLFLTLGELREIHFVLQPVVTGLDTVMTIARRLPAESRAHADGGTATTIPEALIDQLPTLNRDLYDFVRLVPQVSTKISLSSPGMSGGGVGFRFDNFLVNGVSERTPSGGVSRSFTGSKSIPLDAVQEYEVVLAPYDVRYGDFAGLLVNTVTKSGTNTLTGSVFAYGRTDQLAGRIGSSASTPYDREQYGFSAGGPIVRDRLHFFVASELQSFNFPASGPFVGQPAGAKLPVPVAAADLDQFDVIMRGYGLTPGSAGPVEQANPLRNLFTRLDLELSEWKSRLLAWSNYNGSDNIAFSRSTSLDTFSLSNYQTTTVSRSRTTAVQLNTALSRRGGGDNELLVSYQSDAQVTLGPVQQPIIQVSVPSISGGSITLNSGTNETAQGGWFAASTSAIQDNLTLPFGANHVATAGAEVQRVELGHPGGAGSYGTWSFSSLQNLQQGIADAYQVRIDFGNQQAPVDATQYAAYVGDRWQATDGLSLTAGLRADLLSYDRTAPYNPLVDSLFSRRTDQMPRPRVELSPRLGYMWELPGATEQRVRGGLGVFTSRYPLAWAQSALTSYGVGGLLRCRRLSPGFQPPPAFTPSPNPVVRPTACAGGATITTAFPGDVDLVDPNLQMMRVLRSSLAYDRRLPGGFSLTTEALVTHDLSDFVMLNLNLAGPVATDSYGRVMYGTIAPNGIATANRRSGFSEVIDLRNTGRGGSYDLSARLEKTRTTGLSGAISYTFSHARDAQTLIRANTRGIAAWSAARPFSGLQDDLTPGISSNDVPHRVVVSGTYVAPWTRARTGLSFYYVGESGRPFTYISTGTGSRGDLNADGSNGDDPIYVPRNALDSAEIKVSGFSDSLAADNSTATQAQREQAQRKSFQDFITHTPCLRQQRGQILQRNSCREPWSNTTIASIRQAVPVAEHAIEAELDVFNVLNLLNGGWGLLRQAAPALLEQVGQTSAPVQTSQPIFRLNAPRWVTDPVESAFQLQLALRYRF